MTDSERKNAEDELAAYRKKIAKTKDERLFCPACGLETPVLLPQYGGCPNCYGLTSETDCSEN